MRSATAGFLVGVVSVCACATYQLRAWRVDTTSNHSISGLQRDLPADTDNASTLAEGAAGNSEAKSLALESDGKIGANRLEQGIAVETKTAYQPIDRVKHPSIATSPNTSASGGNTHAPEKTEPSKGDSEHQSNKTATIATTSSNVEAAITPYSADSSAASTGSSGASADSLYTEERDTHFRAGVASEPTKKQFWGPFISEIRANAFASNLGKLIEHELLVTHNKQGYYIAFEFDTEAKRGAMIDLIRNAGLTIEEE